MIKGMKKRRELSKAELRLRVRNQTYSLEANAKELRDMQAQGRNLERGMESLVAERNKLQLQLEQVKRQGIASHAQVVSDFDADLRVARMSARLTTLALVDLVKAVQDKQWDTAEILARQYVGR